MKEKPILFSTEMVRAILDGRKTQTSRVITLDLGLADADKNDKNYLMIPDKDGDYYPAIHFCRYQVGDILWVRETFCEVPYEYNHIPIKGGHITIPKFAYRADSKIDYTGIWKPSIHMPREAARIFLRVTDVRVERLQDIMAEDVIAEGIDLSCKHNNYVCSAYPCVFKETNACKDKFAELWNSLNAKRGFGWDTNPWVWVIQFERVNVNGAN